jgi:ankyrin repeat protein
MEKNCMTRVQLPLRNACSTFKTWRFGRLFLSAAVGLVCSGPLSAADKPPLLRALVPREPGERDRTLPAVERERRLRPICEPTVKWLPAPVPAPNAEDLVPLDVRPPKEAFCDGPTYPPDDEPYLEKPRPRRPLLVPRGVVNLALHRPVSSSDPAPIIGELDLVTDGDKENFDFNWVELAPGPQWLQIDLEQSAPIYAIGIWRNWTDCCFRFVVYHGIVVQVADDPQFTRNVRTLFNNDRENVHHLGAGGDRRYVETHEGKLIAARGVIARYVRVYSNGSSRSAANDCIEIAVWGLGREGQARPATPHPVEPIRQVSPPPVTVPAGPVDAEDNLRRTALYRAAEAGSLDVVKSLLDKAADVNHADFLGISPLHVAAKQGHAAVAKLLLERGARVEHADKYGSRPIHEAASSGRTDVLAMLIERRAQLNPRTELGYTPLSWAAMTSHAEAARMLVAKGADPNIADRHGYTPLHDAAKSAYREIVDLLLAGGANVNAQTEDGPTPLDLAEGRLRDLEQGRPIAADAADLRRVIEALRKAGGRNDRQLPPRHLHDAVRKADLAAAAALLRQGADPNAGDGAPLQRAVVNDDKAMVELLLANGADPNRQGHDGETPLHLAAGQWSRLTSMGPPQHRGPGPFAPNRLAIAEALLAKGARPGGGNHNALTAAAYADDLPMVKLLLAKGADPRQCGNDETALQVAAGHGRADIAQALLAAGAAVDARYSGGQTPLHEAAQGGHAEIVRMLLARRAAVNVTGRRNRTPLHAAAYEGHLAIVRMLLDAGAALNPLDANGETPLDLADNADEQPVVQLLIGRGGKTSRALKAAAGTGK